MNKPDATYLADSYRFNWPDEEIEIVVDRIREDRSDGLRADIIIRSQRQPRPGLLLAPTNVGLSLPAWRNQVAKAMDEREPDVDWRGAIEQIVWFTNARWREGETVIDFREYTPGEKPRYLLRPYLEAGNAHVLFAMGGTGKSLFAMAIAVSVASGLPVLGQEPDTTGPVLYLDWEADEATHYYRMMAICRGIGLDAPPPIHYRRQYASLTESAPDLRRRIAGVGAVLVVHDSFGAARGGEPESADSTIKAFNAARSLNTTNLFIDHVTKAADTADKPFGSVYTHNLARQSWGMIASDNTADTAIALINHKSNNGRRGARLAYAVHMDNDEDELPWMIKYIPTDITKIRDLAGKSTARDAITAVMRQANHAMPIDELFAAVSLDMGSKAPPTESALRALLHKYKDSFVPVHPDDSRRVLWGLRSSVPP